MPKPKRSPINYPSFGGGIFRSKDDVEGDLSQLESESDGAEDISLPGEVISPDPLPTKRSDVNERTNVRTNERSRSKSLATENERTNERTLDRTRVRHSFDIYSDQLLSLADIQIGLHRQTGRKPKLGDLVQRALDEFIARQERTNERTNDQKNGS